MKRVTVTIYDTELHTTTTTTTSATGDTCPEVWDAIETAGQGAMVGDGFPIASVAATREARE